MVIRGIGKIRGLQQISTPDGFFIICAIDHRGSFQKLVEKEQNIAIDYKETVEYKIELCSAVAPFASGILLDPLYGAAQCIAAGVMPGNTGLLVSIEASGYESTSKGRLTSLLDKWGVEKIKRMGASAVKILVYYRSDLEDLAQKQLEIVNWVASECIKYDIPFLVEPVSYPIRHKSQEKAAFLPGEKAELVIETARQITDLPIDVLKSEFPIDITQEKDQGKIMDTCRKLDNASTKPWVILSAGVDYDTFKQEVKLACQAGASGFLGGRAIWQEALKYKNIKERINYMNTIVADRLKELSDITVKYGTPWYKKMGLNLNNLADISENWYKRY